MHVYSKTVLSLGLFAPFFNGSIRFTEIESIARCPSSRVVKTILLRFIVEIMEVGEKFESSNKEFAIDFHPFSSSSSFYRTKSLIARKFTKLGYLLLSSLSLSLRSLRCFIMELENPINESLEMSYR